jgi:ATP-dependent DNA ligase
MPPGALSLRPGAGAGAAAGGAHAVGRTATTTGQPFRLSRVRPELVVEVTYLTWTEDNLLRQVSYQGQREDKPARQVVRPVPHPARRMGASR